MVSGGGPIVAVTKRGRTFNMVGTGITNSAAIVEHRHRYDDVFATARFRSGSGKGVTRPLAGSGVSRFVEHVLSRRYFTTSKGQKVSSIVFSAYQRSTTNLPLSYNNEYALFRFDIGPKTDYGWLELSVNYVGTGGAGGPENYDLYPVVDVLGYAYDTNGKPLPAGAIPEPQRLPLALGALALGAVGVTEWRKKRNATT